MKRWLSKLLITAVIVGTVAGARWPGQAEANTSAYNDALNAGDIVIDNLEYDYVTHYPSFQVANEGWNRGASGGQYGGDYALGLPSRPKDMYVEYKPAADKALMSGYYDVYMSYRRASNISNEVPVVIYHNQGYDIEIVNQKNTNANSFGRAGKGNGEWDWLGTYYFSGDGTEYVRITNEGTGTDSNSYVVADAVRFSYRADISDSPPAPFDVNLSSLVVNTAEMSPAFHPGRSAYALSVSKEVEHIQVTATVSESVYTSLSIGGSVALSGEPFQIAIQPGANAIPVVVKAQKMVETGGGAITLERERIYTLNVERARNDDAELSSLTVQPGELTLLSDAEAMATYEMDVELSVANLDITATANDPGISSLTVNGTQAASGTPHTVLLGFGLNTITILVVAEDEAAIKEYVIYVYREAAQGDVTGPGNQPDGRHSVSDLGFVSYHYGATSASPGWEVIQRSDIDGNGVIDEVDVSAIAATIN